MAKRRIKSLTDECPRITADMHASHFIAELNAAEERSAPPKVIERLENKAQEWLDELSRLNGDA
jgi:hypothetical protein